MGPLAAPPGNRPPGKKPSGNKPFLKNHEKAPVKKPPDKKLLTKKPPDEKPPRKKLFLWTWKFFFYLKNFSKKICFIYGLSTSITYSTLGGSRPPDPPVDSRGNIDSSGLFLLSFLRRFN